MNNEDIVSLMERYKRELMEFEKRNTIPVEETHDEPTRAVGASAPEETVQASAKPEFKTVQTDNMPSSEPAAAQVRTQTPAESDAQMQFNDGADTEKSQFVPERTQAAGRQNIPQPRTIFVDPELLNKDSNLANNNSAELQSKYCSATEECKKHGTLRVETYGSNGLYPVSNSRVIVYKMIDGDKYYIYDSHTDASGILDGLELPAPDKSLSETQQAAGGPVPYATYDIYVSHPGFVSTYFENVPIFDSTLSIQSVEMLPKVSGEPENEVIDESV
ncbi:MAG: hypothetical protein ACI4I0_08725 [Acutalibacteraceae bacterium]